MATAIAAAMSKSASGNPTKKGSRGKRRRQEWYGFADFHACSKS
ncbi:hypothetical protein [Rhizobium ruizarguesonis]|nr:hypothetical protein [Rhizobium ruizarguesonis]WSH23302.1 hypothetical protein U8Q07_20800 [Rhizobium ruizarguesonis]WSH36274.1 hypothetical protein U8P70_20880 [Rhizobium ruizarguesonis]